MPYWVFSLSFEDFLPKAKNQPCYNHHCNSLLAEFGTEKSLSLFGLDFWLSEKKLKGKKLKTQEKNSKLKPKTQEFGIFLPPTCQKNGQKTSLDYSHVNINPSYFQHFFLQIGQNRKWLALCILNQFPTKHGLQTFKSISGKTQHFLVFVFSGTLLPRLSLLRTVSWTLTPTTRPSSRSLSPRTRWAGAHSCCLGNRDRLSIHLDDREARPRADTRGQER